MTSDPNAPNKKAQEAELAADLEEIWQEESPTTAEATKSADEVDGKFGTRDGS
ncbi:hypothetical protein ACT3UD_07855 [Glutamicibacter sp. 287]|uniref:hypothetical protein n=1 Tax=Micrococcaceae TaxID=1268 RepID=UPI0015E2D43B|nr:MULTISPECIES: hypothetical protein [unclassified Arthrobacter]